MALTALPGPAALRGAVGFLTRLPVGHDERDWAAFREHPVTFPLSGYLIGGVILPAILLPVPAATAAVVFVAWVYVVTGINHVDGLADLGDAVVVHGDADRRRAVMTDTTAGVGAVLAVALVVAGLALGGFSIASATVKAAGIVVAAEVGAKLGMAVVVCLGSAGHEGLGSQLTERANPWSVAFPALVALPVVAVTWPHPAAGVALIAAVVVALAVLAWANARLGGVSGDVIGATNEIIRVVALHAGVVAWMHF